MRIKLISIKENIKILLLIVFGIFFILSAPINARDENRKGINHFTNAKNENSNAKDDTKNEENDSSNYLTENKDFQFTFLFPVDESNNIRLKVIIPKNFKPLQGDPNAELLEFIPETDKDPYKWSEIITLNKILGGGIRAGDYIDKMNNLFLKSGVENAKILETEKHTFKGYQDATSIIKYQTNGREEVVIFYSVSGPYDIANIQYALPLSSPDNLNTVVQKLKDFIKSNTEVIINKLK